MSPQDHATTESMIRYGGSFVRALGQCAKHADASNLFRLKNAFPDYWGEYSTQATSEANELKAAIADGRCDGSEQDKQDWIYRHLK